MKKLLLALLVLLTGAQGILMGCNCGKKKAAFDCGECSR